MTERKAEGHKERERGEEGEGEGEGEGGEVGGGQRGVLWNRRIIEL